MDKTWVEGQPSAYQQHDITHFPDWKNTIVLDLFFNNLTSGFMFITMLTWLIRPDIFNFVMPFALTLAFLIVLFDLLLLIIDLGDHIRFLHAMRVIHPTAPLSIGVVGLICYSILLFIALVIYWGTVALNVFIGLPIEAIAVLSVLFKLFAVLALIAACAVICYKGVAFSCTSQPGVKKARWLSTWVVCDALTIGMSMLIVVSFALGQVIPIQALVIPYVVLIVFRCFAYALVWMNIHERSSLMYSKSHNALNAFVVYVIGGLCAIAACFFGPLGMAAAAVICLLVGVWERYWVIYVTHPH